MDNKELIGTVVSFKGGVVVRLPDGEEVLCSGAKQLARKHGCFVPQIGQQVRISGRPPIAGKQPRIVDLAADPPL